jgi:O-antigen ligase
VLLPAVAVGTALVVIAPLNPLVGFAVIAAFTATALAVRSPAIPLGIWSGSLLLPLVVGTLPKGVTVSMFAAWTAFAVAIAAIRRNRPRPPLFYAVDLTGIATLLLLALLLLRYPGSLSPGYASEKIQLFIVLGILPFVAGVLIGFVRRDLLLFLAIFGVLTLAAAIVDVYLVTTGQAPTLGGDRLSLSASTNPIGLARTMGAIVLVLLFAIVSTRRGRLRLLLIAALTPAALALFSSGSRGPVLALLFALAALLLCSRANPRTVKRLLLTFVIGGAAAAFAVAAFAPPSAAQRALSAFTDSEQVGETSRYTLWQEAVDAIGDDWKAVVIGQGTGSFDAIDPHQEKYPHNIILELWVELGVFGVLAFVVCVGSALLRLGTLTTLGGEAGALASLIVALLVFGLVNALVSSDITGNADLWRWLGLGSGLVAAERVRAQMRGAVARR